MGKFKVVFYTKGCFVKYLNLRYEGGEIYAFNGQDPYNWSYFEACDLIKGINIEFDVWAVKMWWKYDGGSLKEDLKPFKDNGDACEVVMFAFGNNCEVDIFTKVLDIQPISIDTSPIKPSASKPSSTKISASKASPSKSVGDRTFFGKKLKACTNNAFKPPGVVQLSTQNPSSSNPVKILIPKKKVKNNVVEKRKSDRLRTLKARDIARTCKEPTDPLKITKKETNKCIKGQKTDTKEEGEG
ncbi:hypothetical protein KIW84_024376 [Lathyrus oleraceus]|uniref:PB1-like domain-containing protein n=1 Tax=Pisum sativum TaxID=3888 RepID=A0A9D4YGC8_PEA|nr:hypothetical protein KIW84_024376 [Pisum sativum]